MVYSTLVTLRRKGYQGRRPWLVGRTWPAASAVASWDSTLRAERVALIVKSRSRAMRLTSVAGTGSPANAACRNSMADALAVRRPSAASVMDIYGLPLQQC